MLDASAAPTITNAMLTNDEGPGRISIADRERRSGGIPQDARACSSCRMCGRQEGLAWIDTRKLIAKLKPAYKLAIASDPTLSTKYPSMGRLFDAKSRTARRSAATRREKAKPTSSTAPIATPEATAPPASAPGPAAPAILPPVPAHAA